MQKMPHFDYLIIGSGLAGLQLALQMSKETWFDTYTIALIDASEKTVNDKTWSFWEKGPGNFDAIVKKTWHTAKFQSPTVSLSIPLEDYLYKTIRASDFYKWTKAQLSLKENVHFIVDTVLDIQEEHVQEEAPVKVIGKLNSYSAMQVFDSRIPKDFYQQDGNHTLIHQHFEGWVIETETPSFDPTAFSMMDYRYQHEDSTSFIYVLPFSTTRALVEFTFFTPYTVAPELYGKTIKAFLQKELNMNTYRIVETETGNIPMTDFPFWNSHSKQITRIGTGGGWVKGSTGYSFKHTEKNVVKMLANIKAGNQASKGLNRAKFKFYDKIFLKVLHDENEKGAWIFERFYSKNSIQTMFRFLDEESTFSEDLSIMKSLFSMAFIRAFFKVLLRL